mmetsp:Transcript_3957/g.14974  ORF Transcript_3957/g.14974 Transcript_3957/m.14974 type:complete len:264 (-) Transcript_3957:322-1113(-)
MPAPSSALPPKLLHDTNECFTLFSKNNLTISLASLAPFLHALGISPSHAEMRDLENELRDGLEMSGNGQHRGSSSNVNNASGANGANSSSGGHAAQLTDFEHQISKAQVIQVVKQRVANHHRRRRIDEETDGNGANSGDSTNPTNGRKPIANGGTSNTASSKHTSLSTWRQELEETFNIFDTNHDGFIDQNEWMMVMRRLLSQGNGSVALMLNESVDGTASGSGGSGADNVSDDELMALMKEIDFDKDGRLSFSDFRKYMGFA